MSRKLPLSVLKDKVLKNASWHHTSSMYNRTQFYSVRNLEHIALDEIKTWSTVKVTTQNCTRKVRAEWIEWEGRFRKHRKPVKYESTGTISGNWFFPDNGGKKKFVNGNNFCILEYID